MQDKLRTGVVGAGAWGSALADQLAKKGHDVTLWCFEPDVAESIRGTRVNEIYLPGHALHETIVPTNDIVSAVSDKDMVVVAVPSHHVRRIAGEISPHLGRNTWLVSASKGIEESTTVPPMAG